MWIFTSIRRLFTSHLEEYRFVQLGEKKILATYRELQSHMNENFSPVPAPESPDAYAMHMRETRPHTQVAKASSGFRLTACEEIMEIRQFPTSTGVPRAGLRLGRFRSKRIWIVEI